MPDGRSTGSTGSAPWGDSAKMCPTADRGEQHDVSSEEQRILSPSLDSESDKGFHIFSGTRLALLCPVTTTHHHSLWWAGIPVHPFFSPSEEQPARDYDGLENVGPPHIDTKENQLQGEVIYVCTHTDFNYD